MTWKKMQNKKRVQKDEEMKMKFMKEIEGLKNQNEEILKEMKEIKKTIENLKK